MAKRLTSREGAPSVTVAGLDSFTKATRKAFSSGN
eukprot:IDg8463t1